MQAVSQIIQVDKPGRNSPRQTAMGGQFIQFIHRRLQNIRQDRIVLSDIALSDGKNFLLRHVHHYVHLGPLSAFVPELDNARPGVDKPPEHCFLRNNFGVVAGVRGRRYGGDKGVQVRCPTDAFQVVVTVQPARHNHRINVFIVAE